MYFYSVCCLFVCVFVDSCGSAWWERMKRGLLGGIHIPNIPCTYHTCKQWSAVWLVSVFLFVVIVIIHEQFDWQYNCFVNMIHSTVLFCLFPLGKWVEWATGLPWQLVSSVTACWSLIMKFWLHGFKYWVQCFKHKHCQKCFGIFWTTCKILLRINSST